MDGENEHDERDDMETVWIEQARTGDKRAFSRLVEAYQRPVYSITYRMLGSPEEAEDAAQEAFLRAYANLNKYDPKRKFSTWLFSIANHHCIDRLRKRRMKWISIDDNPVLGNMAGDSPQPERQAISGEDRDEVQRVLDQLDSGYRMPLVLRYWEDCSYEEIAQIMEISIPAVKSRLFRARQQVAELYRNQEPALWPPQSDGKAGGKSPQDVDRHTLKFVDQFGLAWAGSAS
jgi:RNA polymerase sigma-70 factor, ECF subfamily